MFASELGVPVLLLDLSIRVVTGHHEQSVYVQSNFGHQKPNHAQVFGELEA
jgi:hypothetical protein